MAIIYWTNLAGTDFGTASNWSTDTVPGALDQARIADVAVDISSTHEETVLSLTLVDASLEVDGSLTMLEGTGFGENNAGLIVIADRGQLQAGGIIDNAGTIELNSTGDPARLFFTEPGTSLTLSGEGEVAMTDNANNLLDITTNIDNSISGAGSVFLSNNEKNGVIDASGTNNPLIINTSDQTLINAGTLEDTGTGGLDLSGTINSSGGLIEANNGGVSLVGVTLIGGTLKASGGGSFGVGGPNTFDGISAAVNNEGPLNLGAGSTLALEGIINNTGQMATVGGNIGIDAAGATIEGNGTISLTDDNLILPFAVSTIASNAASAKLTNVSNTIEGSGFIGNSGSNTLTLVNQAKGVIDGNNHIDPLIIDTGTKPVTNSGTLEATGMGELYIASPVTNSGGNLIANDGNLVAAAAVTGGKATIQGTGSVEFGAASGAATAFAAGSTGELILDAGAHYTGTVSGFGLTQSIDLPNVQFATVSKSYSSGILTVKDASGDIAKIKFSGSYTLASFNLNPDPDGSGGTLITDPLVVEQKLGNAPTTIAADTVLEVKVPDWAK